MGDVPVGRVEVSALLMSERVAAVSLVGMQLCREFQFSSMYAEELSMRHAAD